MVQLIKPMSRGTQRPGVMGGLGGFGGLFRVKEVISPFFLSIETFILIELIAVELQETSDLRNHQWRWCQDSVVSLRTNV